MRVVLVMWPDTFEDWYQPLGLSRESYLDGYDGEWTISFTGALVGAGHVVHVVHGSRTGAPPALQSPSGAMTHFVRAPLAYRAFVHATWGDRRWSALERFWPAAPVTAALSPALVRRVRSLRPDAVIIQDYESLRYDVLAPLFRAAGLRVVALDTGGSARPSRVPWKPATRRLAHRLLAVHNQEASRLRAAGHSRVEVWPVPVRTDVFVPGDRMAARRALGLAGEERIVFSAGRLHPVKELPALADACSQLGVLLALSGEGSERAALEARGDPRLRLLGRVPIDVVAQWYAACDVVALASRQEGQPVAVLEALACGRAVVATSVGGVAEVIGADECGWLVPPRDTAALRDGLAKALGDQAEADRRGSSGRQLVLTTHSPDSVARWFTERLSG
jgi:glycosyltransferase involved in cell wall biosynthesis